MLYPDMLDSFISESSDLIDEVEPALVNYSKLPSQEERVEVINKLFRNFHSLKGSSGFLGFQNIARLTHEAEALLEQFRRSPDAKMETTQISVLCKTVDLLRNIFSSLNPDTGDKLMEKELNETIKEIYHTIADLRNRGITKSTVIIKKRMRSTPTDVYNMNLLAENNSTEKSKTSLNLLLNNKDIDNFSKEVSSEINFGKESQKTNTNLDLVNKLIDSQYKDESPSKRGTRLIAKITDTKVFNKHEDEIKINKQKFRGRYIIEANELLDKTEQALLDSSQNPELSNNYIQDALRFLHSFKGNSGLMGLADMEKLSHRLEEEIGQHLDKNTKIKLHPFDVVLQMIDILRQAVFDYSCGGTGKIAELDNYITLLNTEKIEVNELETISKLTKEPAPQDLRLNKKTNKINLSKELDIENNTNTQSTSSSKKSTSILNKEPITTNKDDTENISETKQIHHENKPGTSSLSRNDIRVDISKLDAILDMVGELIISESILTNHKVIENSESESLKNAVHQLRRVTNELQDIAMSLRMVPLTNIFRRMVRLVYDLSAKANKSIDLELIGEDTEVDRTVIESIADPLVHIIRNAIDHGIESSEERIKAGKSEVGKLTVQGRHEGGEVWIIVTDDGRGLNKEKILAKAIEKGLVSKNEGDLSDNQIYYLIFEPGFSTANSVTDISGRGIGMDVVKKNIEKLSGKINIKTNLGTGTAIIMRIPLTLAVIEGMIVQVGNTKYIIPVLSIKESLKPLDVDIVKSKANQDFVRIREELIPIIKFTDLFPSLSASTSIENGILIIIEDENNKSVALLADELIGQQEVVIKGLTGWLKKIKCLSGCTILSEGNIGLILDIGQILNCSVDLIKN